MHPRAFRRKALSMSVQAAVLAKERDTIKVQVLGPRLLKWRGRVTPKHYCDTYVIDVEYRTDTPFVPRARVFVVDPLLKRRHGIGCPHRHGEQEPCLYYHRGTEWNTQMLIAHTIVPWTSRWLLFYEIWLATGEWLGGGIAHSPPAERINAEVMM